MAVTGKIILKVKSGPGVLIGDTERIIADNKVDLSGLQFDHHIRLIEEVLSHLLLCGHTLEFRNVPELVPIIHIYL